MTALSLLLLSMLTSAQWVGRLHFLTKGATEAGRALELLEDYVLSKWKGTVGQKPSLLESLCTRQAWGNPVWKATHIIIHRAVFWLEL